MEGGLLQVCALTEHTKVESEPTPTPILTHAHPLQRPTDRPTEEGGAALAPRDVIEAVYGLEEVKRLHEEGSGAVVQVRKKKSLWDCKKALTALPNLFQKHVYIHIYIHIIYLNSLPPP